MNLQTKKLDYPEAALAVGLEAALAVGLPELEPAPREYGKNRAAAKKEEDAFWANLQKQVGSHGCPCLHGQRHAFRSKTNPLPDAAACSKG